MFIFLLLNVFLNIFLFFHIVQQTPFAPNPLRKTHLAAGALTR